jgi:hypothetical protein
MNPTRLNLFCADYEAYNKNYILSFGLEKIGNIRKNCNYTFEVPMPIGIEVIKHVTNKTVKKFFGGTKEIEQASYAYNLIFDKELNETELNMWRMFKMGWRSRCWSRY